MSETDWRSRLQAEFEQAVSAQSAGNEGQARVCARRAAGIAIREYVTRHGLPIPSTSAYDLLTYIDKQANLSPDLQQAVVYLTLRVTEQFKLPEEVDLIPQAHKLCSALLPDWEG